MLTSITLENFKSFRRAAVPLGPFTLLVGTNASGKSNLRDAFRLLHGIGRGYALAEILGERWGEGGELQWKGLRGGAREAAFHGEDVLTVGAVVVWKTTNLAYEISIAPTGQEGGARVVRESLYLKVLPRHMYFDSHPYDNPPRQLDDEHIVVRLPRGGANRRHGETVTFLSSTPAIAQAVKKDALGEDTRSAEAVLETFQSMRFLNLSPDAMRLPSLPGQPVIGDRGERLSSALLAICRDEQKKQTLLEWIRTLTPLDVVDFAFPEDFSGRVLVHLVEKGGRKISAHSASDGTLRFLAMLAALLDPDPSRLYFIEEIENGIHPTRLHLLVQLIEQQCRTGRVQVVATTHSPQLLGFLSPESREHALLVYRLKDAGDSHVKPILELPEVKRVLETQDLGRLHASGWLEDMVELMADEASEAAE